MACGDPGGAKCAGTWTAYTSKVMALSESFVFVFVFVFEPLVVIRGPLWLVFLHSFAHSGT